MSSTKSSTTTDNELSRFAPEIRGYAMAAVILEEWIQELAAIAQEQSVLMKEIAFHVGMAIEDSNNATTATNTESVVTAKKSAMHIENPYVVETSMS